MKKMLVMCAVALAAMVAQAAYTDDCITFLSTASFSLHAREKSWDGTLWTSTNKSSWTEWNGEEVWAARTGGTGSYILYVRGNDKNTKISPTHRWGLVGTAGIACTGNIETLRGATGDNPSPTQMADECYRAMFAGNELLTTAPSLPATTLSKNCYCYMFQRCTSLETAPALPAMALAYSCYEFMFLDCTSLKAPPALPATTIADRCYYAMFWGCTSLTSAPDLPAIVLADECYTYMFYSCANLVDVPVLPATTLANSCYSLMFAYCTSLTTVPELPATALTEWCYTSMFQGCSSIEVNLESPGKKWKIPATIEALNWGATMFSDTAGTLRGQPELNTTYYIKSTPVPPEPKPEGGPYKETIDGIEWTFMVDGNLEANVDGASPAVGNIEIPTKLGGRSVTSIGEWAFGRCADLTSVVIPSSVTTIEKHAFDSCSGLTSVTIPSGVTSIDECAFYQCNKLKNITIPSGLKNVGRAAFRGCGITSVTIPAGLTTIAEDMFRDCVALTSIDVPSNVTSIEKSAFEECTRLRSVKLPKGLTSIGGSAFGKCSSLTSISIPEGVTSIERKLFSNCYSLTSVTIPSSVTSIGERAFYWCTGLKSMTIPKDVTSIDYGPFAGCTALQSISVASGNAHFSSRDGVLFDKNGLTLIQCPGAKSGAYTIPSGATSIGAEAFVGCGKLTCVTIPSSVTSIGAKAFSSCTKMTAIYVDAGNGFYTAQDGILLDKWKTTLVQYPCGKQGGSYTIPSSVASVDAGAFCGCSGLTHVTIPSSVTSLGDDAFSDCSASIDFEGAPPSGLEIADIDPNTAIRYNVAYQAQWLPVIQQYGWTNAKPYTPVVPINDCIMFSSAASFTLKANSGKTWDGTLWTSTDKNKWTEWSGAEVNAAKKGGTYNLYVRGNTDNTVITGGFNDPYNWVLTGNAGIACTGNIETLRGATGNDPSPTKMADFCYDNMFRDCTALTEAPALPATMLAERCYCYMFKGCTLLTEAPALPATMLAEYCYCQMFYGCTSLTHAPALPATMLAEDCYDGMFEGCTSLTKAPALPAMTLADDCYVRMFRGCTALTEAPALLATTLTRSCYNQMFRGCTSLKTAPALPATTLAYCCYQFMFYGCTVLTEAPALPATTLADWCYRSMFSGCEALEVNTTAPGKEWKIPTTSTTASEWGDDMFTGTAGTLQGQPELNRTYYIASAPIPPGPKPEGGPYSEKVGGTTWTFMVDDDLEAVLGTGDPMGETAVPTSTKGAVTIPSELGGRDVAALADYAFAGCSKVTAVTIPVGVEEIGVEVFDGCSSLTAINVAAGNESYSSVDGVLFDGDMTTLIQCPGGKQGAYEVPDDVERIADYAFADCAKITDVTLTSNVAGIGAYAFMDCGMTKITIPSGVRTIGEDAFLGCGDLKTVYVDEGDERRVKTLMERSGFDTDQVEFRIIGETPTFEVVAGMKVCIDVGFVGYTAKNLPKGLSFNGRTGLVTGTTKVTGTYEATFSKKGEWDETAIFEVRDEEDPEIDCPGLEEGEFTVGVAGESGGILIGITAESGVKSVSAKSLPAGMKVMQDKLTKEWYITGGPTKAGYYSVTLTVTTAAGNRADQSYVIEVAALPDMAVGTFNGFVTKQDNAERFDPVIGTIQMTATDAGKISAKVTTADKAYSFTATCWDSGKDGRYSVEMSLKTGETLTLELDTGAGWDEHQLTGSFDHKVLSGPFDVSAQRNAFGKTWSFNAEGDETEGWTLTYAENPKTADLTLTLNADGKTTLAGKLGTLKVSASGYSDVSGMRDGAIIADFAPVVTVNKVKTILSIHTNLWFDRSNEHEFIGSAKLMD